MKGIILAAGLGTRLYPITRCISKQLLPIYNKPMIYYPLSTMMLAGIRDILIITKPSDSILFKNLLGDGSRIGVRISYAIQERPSGIADAFIIGEKFIKNNPVCLALGDNIFYGNELPVLLKSSFKKIKQCKSQSVIFGYQVQNPTEYGVVEYDNNFNVISIEEKPSVPKSDYAITGLYMYSDDVVEKVKNLKPSVRGELEITDLNSEYLKNGNLSLELMGRGYAWFDTGTCEMFFEASNFVRSVENRQGLMISNIEEIAYRIGYIDKNKLSKIVEDLGENYYKEYLLKKVLNG